MRLPNGIKAPDAYWDVLYNGKDMRSPVPISRYNIKGFNDDMGKTNIIKQQHAYFLEDDLAAFDAGLFTMVSTSPFPYVAYSISRSTCIIYWT